MTKGEGASPSPPARKQCLSPRAQNPAAPVFRKSYNPSFSRPFAPAERQTGNRLTSMALHHSPPRHSRLSPTRVSFIPDEGLVCPRQGPRLSPTGKRHVPGNPLHDGFLTKRERRAYTIHATAMPLEVARHGADGGGEGAPRYAFFRLIINAPAIKRSIFALDISAYRFNHSSP